MARMMKSALVMLFLVGYAVAAKECTKEHPKVGYTAEIITLQHEVSGTITVVDDCTFSAVLTWDGEGPDVFWYGADTVDNLLTGVIMDSLNGVHDMKVVTGHLPKGVTWDEIDVLSVWCRQFGVNFGYGTLEAPAASVTVASDVDAPMTETPMSETPMSERDDM